MGQCKTLDADVTIGCYYGDYSSCDNTIPMSLFIWKKFSPHTCLPPFFNYYSYSYHIFFNFRHVYRACMRCTVAFG